MLVLLLLASTALAQTESGWGTDATQHFSIHHESAGSSLGDDNGIERIYEALHPALEGLDPWMTRTKVDVYLYSTRESFLKGRFSPPPWSGGLMSDSAGKKALAIYEPVDTATAAHELTHLYLHSFFDEKQASPPPWLDEGLAMSLQDDALSLPDPREKGPVIRSPLPMGTFLLSRPAQDSPGARAAAWYRQADSVVRFLRQGHIAALFDDFCGKLRDGEDSETALREAYGYEDAAAFEKAWLKWRPKKAVGEPLGLDDQ